METIYETFLHSLLDLRSNLKPFLKPEEVLNALPCLLFSAIFLFTIFFEKSLESGMETVRGKSSFHQNLPLVDLPFTRLFKLGGFINLLRIRHGGLPIIDAMVAKYGDNFRVTLATQEFVAISDADIIKKLLTSTSTELLNEPRYMYELIFSDNLKDRVVLAETALWSWHRKTISRAFTFEEFPKYVAIIDEEVKLLLKSACSHVTLTNGQVHHTIVRQLIEDYALAALIGMILGPESRNGCMKELTEFQETFKRVKHLILERFRYPALLIPAIRMLYGNQREMDTLIQAMNKFSSKMIQTYRENFRLESCSNLRDSNCSEEASKGGGNSSHLSGCLVEQMIMAGNTDKEILDEVNLALLAGSDTVAAAVDFTLFHLAGNMDHQRICREEIDLVTKEAQGSDAENKTLTMEHFSQMKYLERCILESLRLSPPIPLYDRRIDTRLEIDNNCEIEAGQTLLIIPWALHRNPKHFPDPEIFEPDRFLPENIRKRHSHAFIPLSMGPRNCIGWKITILEIKAVVAGILGCFELSTIDKPGDVKMHFGVILKPERPFNVIFQKRKV